MNGIATIQVNLGNALLDVLRAEHFRINAIHVYGIRPAPAHFHLMFAVTQRQDAPLAEHDIEVQLQREIFVKFQRVFVKSTAFRIEVVGSANLRVSSGISSTQPAFLEHSNVVDAVLARKVTSSGQAMTACANDDDVVMILWFGISPGTWPSLVPCQGIFKEA